MKNKKMKSDTAAFSLAPVKNYTPKGEPKQRRIKGGDLRVKGAK